jgi:pyruvate,water dikinase
MFRFFNKKRQEKALRDEDDKKLFIKRYRAFREVLKNNNNVLLTVADMQEKADGAFVFDKAYVETSYHEVASGVKQIIENLNVLANEKYKDLNIPYQKIDAAIRQRLGTKVTIPKTDFVIVLGNLGKDSITSAGGKMALLGELANALGFPVPSGFVVTTYAYQDFVRHNNIKEILLERTKRLDIRNYDELNATSQEMQNVIRSGHIPEYLEAAVFDAYRAMCQEGGVENLKVSIRSSALHEDIMASFAGQYKTALNVQADDLLVEYKNVLSSQFTPRALFYYKDKGFDVGRCNPHQCRVGTWRLCGRRCRAHTGLQGFRGKNRVTDRMYSGGNACRSTGGWHRTCPLKHGIIGDTMPDRGANLQPCFLRPQSGNSFWPAPGYGVGH